MDGGSGRRGKGSGGGARASVPAGRDRGPRERANFVCRTFVVSNAYKKKKNWRFLKDALLGGGGVTHRSWPGGRGGRPRALVAGEGWGGRRGDGSSKERGWGLVGCPKRSKSREGVREGLAWRSGGGARASVAGG